MLYSGSLWLFTLRAECIEFVDKRVGVYFRINKRIILDFMGVYLWRWMLHSVASKTGRAVRCQKNPDGRGSPRLFMPNSKKHGRSRISKSVQRPVIFRSKCIFLVVWRRTVFCFFLLWTDLYFIRLYSALARETAGRKKYEEDQVKSFTLFLTWASFTKRTTETYEFLNLAFDTCTINERCIKFTELCS